MNEFSLEKMIKSLDHSPERAILSILRFHQGKGNAILGEDLQKALAMHGFHINERAMREIIVELRLNGVLIGALPGENGGYFFCTTRDEFEEFIHREYIKKMRSMSEVTKAMIKTANDRWGKKPKIIANQPGLF